MATPGHLCEALISIQYWLIVVLRFIENMPRVSVLGPCYKS